MIPKNIDKQKSSLRLDAASCSESSSRVRPFLDVAGHRGKGTPYPHCELHSQNGRLFLVIEGQQNYRKEFLPSEIKEIRKFVSEIESECLKAIILR